MHSDAYLGAAPWVKQNTMCPFSRPALSPETVQISGLHFPLTSTSFFQRPSSSSQVFLEDPVPVSLLCHVQVSDVPQGTTTSQAAQGCQPTPPSSPHHSQQSSGRPWDRGCCWQVMFPTEEVE